MLALAAGELCDHAELPSLQVVRFHREQILVHDGLCVVQYLDVLVVIFEQLKKAVSEVSDLHLLKVFMDNFYQAANLDFARQVQEQLGDDLRVNDQKLPAGHRVLLLVLLREFFPEGCLVIL